MHRFFIDKKNFANDIIKITGDDYNHIAKSLRLNTGDKIIVCPGNGKDLIVELYDFNENNVLGKVIERKKCTNEPDTEVTIAQAIPKNRNMEFVIQKSTEIGVKNIIPLTTERTIVKLKGKKKEKRVSRWQRIAEEAAKQSQRGIIPEVKEIFSIKKLKTIKKNYDLLLICWASEDNYSLSKILKKHLMNQNKSRILIMIGPEGGFSESEISFMKNELKARTITLGPRILRTETAPLVALSAVFYQTGDLGG